MYCQNCEMVIKDDWKICPTCGTAIKDNIDCEKRGTDRQVFEVSAGDLTVSGQRRYITEVLIEDKVMIIKNYMNTKKFSTPIEYKFISSDIVNLEKRKKIVLRKIHKIRLAGAGIMFLLTFVTGLSYFLLAAFVLALITTLVAREKSLELVLKNGQKIYIYYIDEDDIALIERAIYNWRISKIK